MQEQITFVDKMMTMMASSLN